MKRFVLAIVISVLGLVALGSAILYFDRKYTAPIIQAERQWCIDRGYAVAGVSTRAGKSNINQVVCVDAERRMYLPE